MCFTLFRVECISPISIKVKGERHIVPCGRCAFCLQRLRAWWTFRIKEEMKVSTSAWFVTLTYEVAPLNRVVLDGADRYFEVETLRKRDAQLYMKRLRKLHQGKPLRYYLVGEYGSETFRPHYHLILFNLDNWDHASQAWDKGFVTLGEITAGRIHYMSKWHLNKHFFREAKPYSERAFSHVSKGLGASYLSDGVVGWHQSTDNRFVVMDGYRVSLPRYYKEKMFNNKFSESLKAVAKKEESHLRVLAQMELLKSEHHDPYMHYHERREALHDRIRSKENRNDKL